MILEILAYGFFSAFGWWSANHYIIEPYFPDPIEKKVKKDDQDKRDTPALRCVGKSSGDRDDCGSESPRYANLPSNKD
jgi:hypothetical protein